MRTSGDIRRTVIKLMPGYEYHADNRSPWIILEDAYEAGTQNWETRAARLLENWEQRREAFAREGTELPAAAPPQHLGSSVPSRPPLDLFFTTCVALLDALRAPLDGLVLVLAPSIVRAIGDLDADLLALFARAEFGSCRIVLVLDVDDGLPSRTLEGLGTASIVCTCATDPDQKRRDLQALAGGNGSAAPAAAGAGPAGVTPPRRPNAPPDVDPAVRDAALRDAGIDPAYLEHAPALRHLILGAALAMGEGRTADGIRMQAEVVRISQQVGMPQMAVISQITLASYLSAAGDRPHALAELTAAANRAAEHKLPDQESQAYLAQGLLYMLDRRPLDAANAYYRCAQIAESTNAGVLAVEAWRLAGQAALDGGATEHGVQYMQQALEVAGQLDASARTNTSAPEVARRLAKMYADAGHAAHADSLYAQADAIERGSPSDQGESTAAAAPVPAR